MCIKLTLRPSAVSEADAPIRLTHAESRNLWKQVLCLVARGPGFKSRLSQQALQTLAAQGQTPNSASGVDSDPFCALRAHERIIPNPPASLPC